MKENPEAQVRTKASPWGVNISVTTNGTLWHGFFADKTLIQRLHDYTAYALDNWDEIERQSILAARGGARWINGWAQNFEENTNESGH